MGDLKTAADTMSSKISDINAWATNFAKTPIGIGHGLLTIYAIGYTIQIALLPHVIMELKQPVQVKPVQCILCSGAFAFFQLVGALVFGRLADFIGPRNAFVLALGSSATMYILMAIATNMALLFVSQVPAICMHGFQAAVFLVCLETDEKHRTPSIAYLNLSYGVGMIAGGFVGALASAFLGARGTLLVSGVIQLFGCFLAFALGLHLLKTEWSRVVEIVRRTGSLCVLLLVGLMPILMTRFAFTAVAVDQFDAVVPQPSQTNYLVALIGVVTFGLLAPALATKFGDVSCERYSVPVALVGYLMLLGIGPISISMILLCLLAPLSHASVRYICATSQMTKRVEASEFGSTLGLNSALFFAVAGLSQFVGLPLYAYYGALSFYIFVLDEETFKAYPPDAALSEGLSVFQ
ncbi:transporter, major facilitator family protein [Besnoitia besnoiti]|uniref:Transporter, major facilitator family protein n=1 Tax=Besnoitia besnoiti TaxID=94643 RepID=A0A2A9MKH3_BESBE|nr:transporter, major facilitator family protein [Besnoitia besnoiti]PFH36781.1 transporter, major facilitator family protein [Besnoitia besnoiti]